MKEARKNFSDEKFWRDKKKYTINDWETNNGAVSNDSLKYAKDWVKPGHNYDKDKLQKKYVRWHDLCAFDCRIFDPFVLLTVTFTDLDLTVNDLVHFQSKYFTPSFLACIKIELYQVSKDNTENEFDWNFIEDFLRYERRKNERAQQKERAVNRGDYREVGENMDHDQVDQPESLGNN